MTNAGPFVDKGLRYIRNFLTIFTLPVSHNSCETFARVSHNGCASFIFSQRSLEMVLFMLQSIAFVSHICHIVQIEETKLRYVCERLRRISICKTVANSSQPSEIGA